MGVEDEHTGELTLHEAGHPYALRQGVAGRQEIVEDHAMEGVEWKQRKDGLVNQFGSKKKKAAIRWALVFFFGGGDSVVAVSRWALPVAVVAYFLVVLGFGLIMCRGDGGVLRIVC